MAEAKATDRPPLGDSVRQESSAKGRWQLGCILMIVALLWGLVFPAVSETEFQMEKQRRIEEQGIDPMAMFYTDHPATQERLLGL